MAGMPARAKAKMGSANAARIVFMSTPGNWIPHGRETLCRRHWHVSFDREFVQGTSVGKRNVSHGPSIFGENDKMRRHTAEKGDPLLFPTYRLSGGDGPTSPHA